LCRRGALWWISSFKLKSKSHLSLQQNFIHTLMPYEEFIIYPRAGTRQCARHMKFLNWANYAFIIIRQWIWQSRAYQ
jgi:hypothetical protein